MKLAPIREESSPRRVLLVEPHTDTRALLKTYFAQHDWQVEEADDGRVALAMALAMPPDVVVAEVRLPGISGFALCRELRADALTTRVPVVLVSHEAPTSTLQEAEACGASRLVVKPCLPEQLHAQLLSLVADSPTGAKKAVAPRPAGADADAAPRKRLTLVRSHQRQVTTTPPLVPPPLVCPSCDGRLVYERSHVGGVSLLHTEQWDYYRCGGCSGAFQYRQRTRKLRRM